MYGSGTGRALPIGTGRRRAGAADPLPRSPGSEPDETDDPVTRGAVVAALASLAVAASADARPLAVPTAVRCARACADPQTVAPGGTIRVIGHGFRRGLRASFALSRAGRRRTVAARVLGPTRLSAPVPAGAISGRVWLLDRAGRRTARSGRCASRRCRRARLRPTRPAPEPRSTAPACGSGRCGAPPAETRRPSWRRRAPTRSRPSSSRAPTGPGPIRSSPRRSSPRSRAVACASAPGSTCTAPSRRPRRSCPRRPPAPAPTAS